MNKDALTAFSFYDQTNDKIEESQQQIQYLISKLDFGTDADEVSFLLSNMGDSLNKFSENQYELEQEIQQILSSSKAGLLSHEQLSNMVQSEQLRSKYLTGIVVSLKIQIENLFQALISKDLEPDDDEHHSVVEKVQGNMNLLWKSVDSLSRLIGSPTKKLNNTIKKIDSEVIVHVNQMMHLQQDRVEALHGGESLIQKMDKHVSEQRLHRSRTSKGKSFDDKELNQVTPKAKVVVKEPDLDNYNEEVQSVNVDNLATENLMAEDETVDSNNSMSYQPQEPPRTITLDLEFNSAVQKALEIEVQHAEEEEKRKNNESKSVRNNQKSSNKQENAVKQETIDEHECSDHEGDSDHEDEARKGKRKKTKKAKRVARKSLDSNPANKSNKASHESGSHRAAPSRSGSLDQSVDGSIADELGSLGSQAQRAKSSRFHTTLSTSSESTRAPMKNTSAQTDLTVVELSQLQEVKKDSERKSREYERQKNDLENQIAELRRKYEKDSSRTIAHDRDSVNEQIIDKERLDTVAKQKQMKETQITAKENKDSQEVEDVLHDITNNEQVSHDIKHDIIERTSSVEDDLNERQQSSPSEQRKNAEQSKLDHLQQRRNSKTSDALRPPAISAPQHSGVEPPPLQTSLFDDEASLISLTSLTVGNSSALDKARLEELDKASLVKTLLVKESELARHRAAVDEEVKKRAREIVLKSSLEELFQLKREHAKIEGIDFAPELEFLKQYHLRDSDTSAAVREKLLQENTSFNANITANNSLEHQEASQLPSTTTINEKSLLRGNNHSAYFTESLHLSSAAESLLSPEENVGHRKSRGATRMKLTNKPLSPMHEERRTSTSTSANQDLRKSTAKNLTRAELIRELLEKMGIHHETSVPIDTLTEIVQKIVRNVTTHAPESYVDPKLIRISVPTILKRRDQSTSTEDLEELYEFQPDFSRSRLNTALEQNTSVFTNATLSRPGSAANITLNPLNSAAPSRMSSRKSTAGGWELPIYDNKGNILVTRTYKATPELMSFHEKMRTARNPFGLLYQEFAQYLSPLSRDRLLRVCLPHLVEDLREHSSWLNLAPTLLRHLQKLFEDCKAMMILLEALESVSKNVIQIIKTAKKANQIEAHPQSASHFSIANEPGELIQSSIFDLNKMLGEIEAQQLTNSMRLAEFRAFFERVQVSGSQELEALCQESKELRDSYTLFTDAQGFLVQTNNQLHVIRERCERYRVNFYLPRTIDPNTLFAIESNHFQSNYIPFEQSNRMYTPSLPNTPVVQPNLDFQPLRPGSNQAHRPSSQGNNFSRPYTQSHSRHSVEHYEQMIAQLREELQRSAEEIEDLEYEIMDLVKERDNTPAAILFFSLMHDPAYVPNLQQLSLQFQNIKGFLDYSVPMDYVTLRKRLQVCLVLMPSIDKLIEKYATMYKAWSTFRLNWFAERNLRGGAADGLTYCPLCFNNLVEREDQLEREAKGTRSPKKYALEPNHSTENILGGQSQQLQLQQQQQAKGNTSKGNKKRRTALMNRAVEAIRKLSDERKDANQSISSNDHSSHGHSQSLSLSLSRRSK